MIKELWTDISLENYNKWYPLTGIINDTPQQYVNTWPNANEWFTTFAIRAQNDINAYLNFILYKFPFDSFKDKLIQETLRDMVYVMIEHWVFNRTPIEFNVDANIQFNNGTQFSASSIPTINVWDLAPSRMKILAQLTQLKELLMSYDEQEIDVDKIDLEAFYTRNQVDELIENEKEQRISGDKDNHDFILTKQMKLYDDVVSENEHEVYRGPVTNLVVKGFIATDYDKDKETAVINFPKEIGTLPPEALQNNPQENDFTHAATADFSAKQQKRITNNENNINLANKEIENIKNNYFNIETSPLWKEVKNENIELFKWYVVSWVMSYDYDVGNLVNFRRTTKVFLSVIDETIAHGIFTLDSVYDFYEIDINRFQNGITIAFNMPDKRFTSFGYNHPRHEPNTGATIEKVYQYQGTGTPTEFIEETNNNDNYYTKTETNELLDKKQDKLIAGTNITIDENNKISATGGSSVDENRIFNNKNDKDNTTRLVNDVIKTNVNGKTLIYRNNPNINDDLDIPNKKYIDDKEKEINKKLEDKIDKNQFQFAFLENVIGSENPNLETTNKKVAGAINENKTNIDKKQDKENWVVIGNKINNKTWSNFNINVNKTYRAFITWEKNVPEQNGYQLMIFFKSGNTVGSGEWIITNGKIDNKEASLIINADPTKIFNKWTLFIKCEIDGGAIFSFEELREEKQYLIESNTLDIIPPSLINIKKPIKINSKSLETNEIEENYWDIELKDIPPTPCPCPQWKEVGARKTKNQINYDFFPGKKYRVTYIWDGDTQPISYSISKEFNKLLSNKYDCAYILDSCVRNWNLDQGRIELLKLEVLNNIIRIITATSIYSGNILKLEELQE